MKKYKMQICIAAAVVLLGAAVFCGFQIYHHYAQVEEQTEAFEQMAKLVEKAPEEAIPEDTPVSEGEDVLAKYRELYLQNEDMVGWISIAGTKLNYPVMQTTNNPNFYLKHNFEKAYSDLGTPYIQENCNLLESDNLVIYGHHMNDGSMFADLCKYTDADFCKEHPEIAFDTLSNLGKYEVVAAFKFNTNRETFKYNEYTLMDEAQFAEFMENVRARQLYDTGVTAEYGDQLLTLSTCEYTYPNGRFVVIAKKV